MLPPRIILDPDGDLGFVAGNRDECMRLTTAARVFYFLIEKRNQ